MRTYDHLRESLGGRLISPRQAPVENIRSYSDKLAKAIKDKDEAKAKRYAGFIASGLAAVLGHMELGPQSKAAQKIATELLSKK